MPAPLHAMLGGGRRHRRRSARRAAQAPAWPGRMRNTAARAIYVRRASTRAGRARRDRAVAWVACARRHMPGARMPISEGAPAGPGAGGGARAPAKPGACRAGRGRAPAGPGAGCMCVARMHGRRAHAGGPGHMHAGCAPAGPGAVAWAACARRQSRARAMPGTCVRAGRAGASRAAACARRQAGRAQARGRTPAKPGARARSSTRHARMTTYSPVSSCRHARHCSTSLAYQISGGESLLLQKEALPCRARASSILSTTT